jgi:hypothetical protein
MIQTSTVSRTLPNADSNMSIPVPSTGKLQTQQTTVQPNGSGRPMTSYNRKNEFLMVLVVSDDSKALEN